MNNITIVVCDDYEVLRKGIVQLLRMQPHFEVVSEATNGEEVVEIASSKKPDLILMDLQMPEMDGIEATRIIREFDPNVKIIILTISDEDDDLFEAIKSGANGYLLKNVSMDDLFVYLKIAYQGEAPFSKGLAEKVLKEFALMSKELEYSSENKYHLSTREKEILELVAQGNTNKVIADQLHISPHTVKKHLQNTLSKLQVSNRSEAAVKAIQEGIVRGKSSD
ncbi:response regulator transcription factor [Alkalihalobacillus macyae]|uniref:response regulator n=1 Tax=Guptibacillus hwajinpoensis TaxID=208199 RepID=UPI00273CD483|nr:response regulator transcription factor [Alkalihalobacillus macyae]MDP4552332.1 response regulator transcription factor [Alkalihalobacillus macyae]